MGRESRAVKSERRCKKCKLSYLNMTAAQIQVHAYVCTLEKLTGIEIIKMGPSHEDEATEITNT